MRLDLYINEKAEALAKEWVKDMAQDIAQDIAQGMVDDAVAKTQAADARLAAALVEAGRGDEIPQALSDEAYRKQLVKELGLEG